MCLNFWQLVYVLKDWLAVAKIYFFDFWNLALKDTKKINFKVRFPALVNINTTNKLWWNVPYQKFFFNWSFQELDKIVEYELKIGGVLLHPTFSGGKEKDKYVNIQFQLKGSHWMTPWLNVSFCFSPTPHLHFSIKHPHTLSWEYYKMFQCKAHLVMRLIENRISMEFMLQVNKLLCPFPLQ